PISTPEATALDLVRYANRIGGGDTVMTILQELVESMAPSRIADIVAVETERAPLQRLGWFLDRINASDLADTLHSKLSANAPLPRAKLDPSGAWESSPTKNRWNIVENIQPESDL
ncbi:MAG: type IV toxin-antitoxin system AbiEi family antitoxin, partial [Terrimicrobiaceae bacterium]